MVRERTGECNFLQRTPPTVARQNRGIRNGRSQPTRVLRGRAVLLSRCTMIANPKTTWAPADDVHLMHAIQQR
jgi:hypothetical protein